MGVAMKGNKEGRREEGREGRERGRNKRKKGKEEMKIDCRRHFTLRGHRRRHKRDESMDSEEWGGGCPWHGVGEFSRQREEHMHWQ